MSSEAPGLRLFVLHTLMCSLGGAAGGGVLSVQLSPDWPNTSLSLPGVVLAGGLATAIGLAISTRAGRGRAAITGAILAGWTLGYAIGRAELFS